MECLEQYKWDVDQKIWKKNYRKKNWDEKSESKILFGLENPS